MTAEDIPVGLLVRILNKIKRIFSMSSVVAHSLVVYHERAMLSPVYISTETKPKLTLGYCAPLKRVALGCLWLFSLWPGLQSFFGITWNTN